MARTNVLAYARLTGVLGLLSFIGGGFGEAYVPSVLIVRHDAAATAANVLGSEGLFRLGFAAYLLEAVCDVGVTWALYVLLRPVQPHVAILAVLFRVIATAGFAMSQAVSFSALPVLEGTSVLRAFSDQHRQALALILSNTGSFGTQVFSMFYGVAALLLGHLIWRSRFLPRLLGALLGLSGVAFILHLLLVVLAPSVASPIVLITAAVAWLSLTLWLLFRGVDVEAWHEAEVRTRAS